MKDEIVQYYIVNSDLNMSPGKVAAQIAHAATIMTIECYNLDGFEEWFNNYEQKKIILRGKQKDLERILNELGDFTVKVIDNGHNEVPAGSFTVLGIKPIQKSIIKSYIKRLQLY